MMMFVKMEDDADRAAENYADTSTGFGGCHTALLTCMVFCVRMVGVFFMNLV